MSLFLGFDAGGTKTDCILIDSAGRLLAETRGGGANPMRAGFARACDVLGETAQRALADAGRNAENVGAICDGVAGAGRPRVARRIKSYFLHAFPHAAVRIVTDIELALSAAAGDGPGVVIIAGTGSAVGGRNAAGQIARAGGWGPWIGDDGSAYDVGRRAVKAALAARDGVGPATLLGEKILIAQETHDWQVVIGRIAKRPDSVFPPLFPLVTASAVAGDIVSQEILAHAGKLLAVLAANVITALGMQNQPFLIAKSGGVFSEPSQLESVLSAELFRVAPKAQIEPLRVSPARAAAELARKSVAASVAHGS
ncbi:MAG: BadF/BadG/BcrA/BcrD ATPase family protein [Candidatus Acidiferrales bacterium]